MDIRSQKLSCEKAKEMDMVEYLSSIGYEPKKIRHNNYWYLSPFREETEASFKVNRRRNWWYDFGEGTGGNIIDFGIRYFGCTVSDFLKKLSDHGKGYTYHARHISIGQQDTEEEKINIIGTDSLHTFSLCKYLHERKIPLHIADKYCREVTYEFKGKQYMAIGFENDRGGYELRSPFFKGGSSPKDITTIRSGHYNVCVFEGFFDFLSYQAFFDGLNRAKGDFIILNSLSFFQKARPFMEQHSQIFLHLDNDKAGQNCVESAKSLSEKYIDSRSLFSNFKDVNEWLVYMRPF
nr:toprim domain-containing protein [uncultured Sphingobacterium sp.]